MFKNKFSPNVVYLYLKDVYFNIMHVGGRVGTKVCVFAFYRHKVLACGVSERWKVLTVMG